MKSASGKTKEFDLIKEIYEQVDVIDKLLKTYVDFSNHKINISEFGYHVRHLPRLKRFLFLGCGSSANASLLGSYYFEELCGKNCEYEFADEFIARRAVIEVGTAVVLISQSGRSKDLLVAASIARRKGAFLIGITNTPGSPLDRMCDVVLHTGAGVEKAMAATKSFSSQLLLLFILALYFSDLSVVKLKNKKDIFKDLKQLPKMISKSLESEKLIQKIAKSLAKKKSILVCGRKFNFPIALEAAHKIKETAYIHAEGFAAEELRHGGEAILEKGFPVFCVIPSDSVYKDNLVLVRELQKNKASVYSLSDKNTKELKQASKNIIPLIKTNELLMPIVALMPLQMLAYYLAVAKDIDLNKPRNISKFVG